MAFCLILHRHIKEVSVQDGSEIEGGGPSAAKATEDDDACSFETKTSGKNTLSSSFSKPLSDFFCWNEGASISNCSHSYFKVLTCSTDFGLTLITCHLQQRACRQLLDCGRKKTTSEREETVLDSQRAEATTEGGREEGMNTVSLNKCEKGEDAEGGGRDDEKVRRAGGERALEQHQH